MVVGSLRLRTSLRMICDAGVYLKNSGSHMTRLILFGSLNLQCLDIDIQWYSMTARYPGVKFNLQIILADLAPKRLILPRGLLAPLAIYTHPHRHPVAPFFHPPPILNTLTRPEHVRTTSLQAS